MKPIGRFFPRFHLLPAVLMVLAASGCLLLNFSVRQEIKLVDKFSGFENWAIWYEIGWPKTFYYRFTGGQLRMGDRPQALVPDEHLPNALEVYEHPEIRPPGTAALLNWDVQCFILDLILAFLICIGVGAIAELLTRKKSS